MEIHKETERLYTPKEHASIIRKFNVIYNILKSRFSYIFNSKFWLKNDTYIVNVQRWIICWEEKIFRDYLWATHNTVENTLWIIEQKWKNTTYRCIKLIFWGWETLTLCTNSLPEETPEGSVCLDEYYLKLNYSERNMYDNILRWIWKLEYEHFHSNWYWKEIDRIKTLSKENIFTALNMSKS